MGEDGRFTDFCVFTLALILTFSPGGRNSNRMYLVFWLTVR